MPTIESQIAFIEDNAGMWRDVAEDAPDGCYWCTTTTGKRIKAYCINGLWSPDDIQDSGRSISKWLDEDGAEPFKASLIKSLTELKEVKEKEAKRIIPDDDTKSGDGWAFPFDYILQIKEEAEKLESDYLQMEGVEAVLKVLHKMGVCLLPTPPKQ